MSSRANFSQTDQTNWGVWVDRGSKVALHRQLCASLRAAILDGRLSAGTQLPPTRVFAEQLGVSRNTVVNAFEQLIAEGYLVTKAGAGTFISQGLQTNEPANQQTVNPIQLSLRGQWIMDEPAFGHGDVVPFLPGMPDVREFPFAAWEKLLRKQRDRPMELGYNDAQGFVGLRTALAAHLQLARGVRCSAEQIVITSGTQQGLDLAARLLADAGECVWLENPGYTRARTVFRANGLEIVPVELDRDGIDLSLAEHPAKLAYVTPSHQYPLGVTMSAARRMELLAWAAANDGWILEDDYDSEFRFAGQPLPSLQGLDTAGRVIYVGTLSKTLFPALRLGYLVVPVGLVVPFRTAMAHTSRTPNWMVQRAMAAFFEDGHYARHVRRMRLLYAERQQVLLKGLKGLPLEVNAQPAGLHVLAWLDEGVDDVGISAELAKHGVSAAPLSHYTIGEAKRGGLVLGFGGFTVEEIRDGIERMSQVFGK